MPLFQKLKTVAQKAVTTGTKMYQYTPLHYALKTGKKVLASQKAEKTKQWLIRFFARIDYDLVLKHLNRFRYLDPRLAIAILVIEKSKFAFDNYNQSKLENRELKLSEQLLAIGKDFKLVEVMEILAPFARKIPFGKSIMFGLRLINKQTADK